MMLVIGGPVKEEPKKGGFMGMKQKKISGIGGEYDGEKQDQEGPGMDNEEKMLEAARPLARAAGIPSSVVVETITTICNLMSNNTEKSNPVESEEGDD